MRKFALKNKLKLNTNERPVRLFQYLILFVALYILGFSLSSVNPSEGRAELGDVTVRTEEKPITDTIKAQKRERRAVSEQAKRLLLGPNSQFRRDDGFLNKEIIKLAGIPEQHSSELSSIVEETWEELTESFEKRAILSINEPGSKNGKIAYFIPGDPVLSESVRKRLSEKIIGKFGKGAARILMPYLDSPNHFAGLGAFDTTLSFKNSMSRGNHTFVAEYSITDPATGKVLVTGGSSDPKAYRDRFGTAFLDRR